MSEKKKVALFTVINLILINGVILGYLNIKYPMVGHDYSLGIPTLLDNALHFRLNGLAIEWFTPSFGGGIPSFPNPNSGQYSLLGLLMIFLPPWTAVMTTVVIYVSLGFVACEYFLLRILNFHWTAGIAGAIFFSANGFIIERVAAGHLGYITFPLLPIFLILLIDKSLPAGYAGVILGLITAMLLYFAGYFIIIVFGLSLLSILPLLFIYNSALINRKKILTTLAIGSLIALLISICKLTAGYSFMRFFPRTIADEYDNSLIVALFGILLQLMGTMNLVPLFLMAGLKPDSLPYYMPMEKHYSFGLWEVDMSLSPIVFIILLIAVTRFLHSPKKFLPNLLHGQRKLAWLLFLLAIWLNTEFILARGLIYPLAKHLPILSSLHVNVRFAAGLIFPITFGATALYNKWVGSISSSKVLPAFLLINMTTGLFLGTYFLYQGDLIGRIYDATTGQRIYEQIQSGNDLEVTQIGKTPDNSAALLTGVSNLNLYEPVFGYHLEDFHPKIEKGSVWQISNGYYNLTDPTGYVYPELNHNQPFARFSVNDKSTMELFVKHIQPDWQIPVYQHILNWVSGLSFLLALGYLMVQGIQLRSTTKYLS